MLCVLSFSRQLLVTTRPHCARLEKAIKDKEKEMQKCREAINTLQKGDAAQ